MRIPDPKANTTTEAYLAYKAEYLEESELKPSLYEPYLHFDGWLAYWAGLTNDYPLDNNGDPEMLTDEEALVAYLAGVTDTYPEEIKDPYDVRIVGYLKHLISIRWPEPDYPVNNEEFYLSTMEPTHTSNPTPSADIELDTSEGKILDVKAYGDIYQQTYTGKNILNVVFASSSEPTSGISWTANNDGSLTINGTATDGVFIRPSSWSMPQDWVGKTLTMSIANSDPNLNIGFKGSGNQFIIPYGNSKHTQVITEDNVSLSTDFSIYIKSGAVLNNFTIFPMVEVGSTATSYEPYVGGISSPNPNYPQGVYTVTGEQLVKTHGKNLMNIPNFTSSQQGIDAKGSNQTVELTGTAGNTYYPDFRFYANGTYGSRAYRSGVNQIDSSRGFFTEPNSEYKLSIFVEGDTPYAIMEGFETKVTNNLGLVGDQVITINDSERLNFVSISISQNVKADIKVRFQIEKGSTATDYQPYQSQSYKINLGKNLFNGIYEKAFIGGSAGNGYLPSNNTRSAVIPCYPNTVYTITKGASTSRFIYGDYPTRPVASDTNTIRLKNRQSLGQQSDTTATITTSPDARYMVVYVSNTSEEPQLQVEVGNTATPYASYFEPIELCKIGDYQDYIYKNGDDWYIHKEIGKSILNSSFTWEKSPSVVLVDRYRSLGIPARAFNQTSVFCCSSHNLGINANDSDAGKLGVSSRYSANGGLFFALPLGIAGTVEDFGEWLDENEPIAYYVLIETSETKITNSSLVTQLEALLGADTYDEKTFIKVSATDPNLPALLKVEAYSY